MRTARAPAEPVPRTPGELLTLSLRANYGESLVQLRAASFRICADGAIRANGNTLVAMRTEDGWRFARSVCRDFECHGPVYIRARRSPTEASQGFGPFALVRTIGPLLFANEQCLDLKLPRRDVADACHEISLLMSLNA